MLELDITQSTQLHHKFSICQEVILWREPFNSNGRGRLQPQQTAESAPAALSSTPPGSRAKNPSASTPAPTHLKSDLIRPTRPQTSFTQLHLPLPTMSSHDTPTIYAELLTNIRQLSVAVTLPSSAGGQTRALIAPNGETLHIHHAGTETSFPLPGRVLAQTGAPTALPTPPPSASSSVSQTLSWRLPLADSPVARSSSTSLADDPVPWTARDLLPGSAVACRRCAAVVVPGGKAWEWKDLPSENWAEMMDFWHCHKPSTDHEDEHEHGVNGEGKEKDDHEHLTRRGYGANSSIAAQPGVGMVDLTSFLFCEADCVGLKVSGSLSLSLLHLCFVTRIFNVMLEIHLLHTVGKPPYILKTRGHQEGGHVGSNTLPTQ